MTLDALAIATLILVAIAVFIHSRIERRLAKNEQRLLALLRHFGLEDAQHPLPSNHVRALLLDPEKKSDAVKQYRMETGLGLKDAVEGIEVFLTAHSAGDRHSGSLWHSADAPPR